MKRLKNPHLPSIVDVIEQGERLLIVMDYVEGQTLEAMLREQGASRWNGYWTGPDSSVRY